MTAAHVSEAGTTVGATTASSVAMLTWPGVTARGAPSIRDVAHRPGPPRGDVVGTEVVTLGRQSVSVPVRLQRDVPRPSLLQRIF